MRELWECWQRRWMRWMKRGKPQNEGLPNWDGIAWHNRREMWEVRRRILVALSIRFKQEAARHAQKELLASASCRN